MKKIYLLSFIFLFACSKTLEYPKAPIVKEAERMVKKAEQATLTGDTESAISLTEYALILSEATNIPDLRIKTLLTKANISIQKKDFNSAIMSIEEAKKIATHENKELLPFVEFGEVVFYWIIGEKDLAETKIKEIKDIPDALKSSFLNLKSMAAINKKDYETAFNTAIAAYDVSKEINNFIDLSFSLKLLAFISFKQKSYDKSINYVLEALPIDRTLYIVDYMLWDFDFLGNVYKIKGDNVKAIYYYQQGFKVASGNKMKQKADYFKSKLENP